MLSFRLTKKAIKDIKDIGRYTRENWGREQRNLYLSRLDDCFQLIAREPQIGKACDYIRSGYQKYHVGRHLIFYRQSSAYVEIIRILHDRMDVESHLSDS